MTTARITIDVTFDHDGVTADIHPVDLGPLELLGAIDMARALILDNATTGSIPA